MSSVCPHCETAAGLAPPESGVRRCTACGRSSLAPEAESAGAAVLADATRTLRRRRPRRAPGEGPDWPSALGAIVLTGLVYGVLFLLPPHRLTELFLERGWVPVVITAVSCWALLSIGARFARLRREGRMLEQDLLAEEAPAGIDPSEAAALRVLLARRSEAEPGSFLVGRLERALRHFESRPHVGSVVDFLAAESLADEGRVDASYALVRVFVWVVPTLGFIGTVLGIGEAVGGFSASLDAAASLDAMKASIGTVTGGLGVAFDTTLLALVMSIFIMFPASAVQRLEESLVGEVDDYCAELLVPRLREARRADGER